MKKNIKKTKRYQKPLMCLIVILIFLLGIVVDRFMSANADEITYEYQSNNIDYDNSTSNLSATNVKDAIDELYEKVGKCPKGQFCSTSEELVSKFGGSGNFVSAYVYDENSCVTGNESGCVKTSCYLTGSCDAGTIIDYFVNNYTVVRFHVLHDNGITLTMQTQKNTVYNTAWYSGGNNHKEGPQTIMAELKAVTNSWSNVKDITLADGITQFNDGISANNKCTAISCSSVDENYGYTYNKLVSNALIGSAVKARMITITETAALGCTASNKSCPIYLYNYLQDSTSYCRVSGKCINDKHTENGGSYNYGYWTMGVDSSYTSDVWSVISLGRVSGPNTTSIDSGARAVVVVNK